MIVYESSNEVLVCANEEQEKAMLVEYFEEGGWDLDDYDRTVTDGPVQIERGLLEVTCD